MPNEETVPNKPKWANTQLAVVDRSAYYMEANNLRWQIDAPGQTCLTALVREKAYADLFAAAADLYQTLNSDALFLRRFLEQVIHVPAKDERGYVVNGFAAAQIPDWEIRQRLDDIEAALAKARGEK